MSTPRIRIISSVVVDDHKSSYVPLGSDNKSQHGREIRSRCNADDTQQSHRCHRLQHGRPLRALNVPGETLVMIGICRGWHFCAGYSRVPGDCYRSVWCAFDPRSATPRLPCSHPAFQAYELFSHEADTGMVIPAASRLKNVQWHTQTVLFGWASQGVWPPELDGTEVTADMPFVCLSDPGAIISCRFKYFEHCLAIHGLFPHV